MYVHTHTESCKPFIFWTLQGNPQQSSGMVPLHTLPLNAQALTGPPAGFLVVQALSLAVKLPWLSGRQDLRQHIR